MMKSKFSLDYAALDTKLSKRAYRLSDVKDKIEIVAWDVVRFRDEDKGAKLWQIQPCSDGDYIVSLYEDEDTTKTASPWETILSKTSQTLNVFYKGAPIAKVAASQLGIPSKELDLVERYLPSRLASNPKLVQALLSQLSEPAKKEVYSKYPELAQVAQ